MDVPVYLYKAVDSDGNTVKFMLSPTRDGVSAKRFFRKALRAAIVHLCTSARNQH